MAKIYAPNKQYTGVSASVTFFNGVGETSDPRLLQWFREHGYTVEEEPQDESKPLEEMTVVELRGFAEQHGIELGETKKKAEILALIQAAISGGEQTDGDPSGEGGGDQGDDSDQGGGDNAGE